MIIANNTKETEVKRNLRESAIERFYELANSQPDFKGKVSRIENGIAIAVDDVQMSDGTLGEICIEIKPTVPDYVDKINSYGEVRPAYERLKKEDNYYEKIMKKEEKAEKARKEKEERAEKLRIAKMERLRQKLATLENSAE